MPFFVILLRIVNLSPACYNQRVMKRFTLVILAFFLFLTNISVQAAQNYTKKNLTVVTNDKFVLKADLTYPKIKNKKNFQTVVLLHSLGTNSGWWENIPNLLLENGYAVLTVDLRGHGASVYNPKLTKVSWKNLTNNSYKKYPDEKDEFGKLLIIFIF